MQPPDLKLFSFEINILRPQLEEIASNGFFLKLFVAKYQCQHGTSKFEVKLTILILLSFYKAYDLSTLPNNLAC